MRSWSTVVAAAVAVATIGAGASAQTSTKKTVAKASAPQIPPPTSTILVGVYTGEQAERGREVYASSCRSCHTPVSHTGETFNRWWRGKRLSDLFSFVQVRMPKNDPGSLAAEDVADVVSYLLKMNAIPTGENEMVADADSLKNFKIEPKRSGKSTATRKKP
ncbi:MAG: cytochrome c [Gemmatimonadaceae bacterium]